MTDRSMTPPEETAALERVEHLRVLLEKVSGKAVAEDYHFPWSVKASAGKPIIQGNRSGNLFNGYIATWDEADLIVAAVNALPALPALARRAEAAEKRVGELEAGLMPFARAGGLFAREPEDPRYHVVIYRPAAGDDYKLTDRHLRAARALITPIAEGR